MFYNFFIMEYTKSYFYFVKVVEAGSISAASKQLNLAQPFLSNYIKELENKVGSKLLNRNTKPVSLTNEGEAFFKAAKNILEQENSLFNFINKTQKKDLLELNVGVGSTRVKYLLDDVISNFCIINKSVRINIIELINENTYHVLRNGKADLIIHFNNIDSDDIVSTKLGAEKLVVASNKPIQKGDISNLPRIVLNRGQFLRNLSDQLCKNAPIVMECEKIDTALHFCKKGLGTTIAPSYLLKDIDGLYTLDIDNISCSRDIFVSYSKNNFLSDLLFDFVKECEKFVRL